MRLAVARDEGLQEDDIAKVGPEQREQLTVREHAALDLADALMTNPARIDAELQKRIHEHFNTSEIIELTLDVMKWNGQKVPVALGTDTWLKEGELTDLVFDEQGRWIR